MIRHLPMFLTYSGYSKFKKKWKDSSSKIGLLSQANILKKIHRTFVPIGSCTNLWKMPIWDFFGDFGPPPSLRGELESF